jgi:hypothetical protein
MFKNEGCGHCLGFEMLKWWLQTIETFVHGQSSVWSTPRFKAHFGIELTTQQKRRGHVAPSFYTGKIGVRWPNYPFFGLSSNYFWQRVKKTELAVVLPRVLSSHQPPTQVPPRLVCLLAPQTLYTRLSIRPWRRCQGCHSASWRLQRPLRLAPGPRARARMAYNVVLTRARSISPWGLTLLAIAPTRIQNQADAIKFAVN